MLVPSECTLAMVNEAVASFKKYVENLIQEQEEKAKASQEKEEEPKEESDDDNGA